MAAFELLQEEKSSTGKDFVACHRGTLPADCRRDKIAGMLILVGTARPGDPSGTDVPGEADGNITADEEEQIELIEQQVNIKDPGLSAATPATELLGIPLPTGWTCALTIPLRQQKSKVPMLFCGERDYRLQWKISVSGRKLWAVCPRNIQKPPLSLYCALASLPAEYETPGVSDAVINDLVDWIKGH